MHVIQTLTFDVYGDFNVRKKIADFLRILLTCKKVQL